MSELGDRIDAIHNSYRSRFAGFPRITRDPEELEALLGDVAELERDSGSAMTDDERSLLATNRQLYEKELQGIKEARAQGPAALQAHRLQTWANFVQSRYARMFAGQNRRTRDLGILAEMIDDKTRILSEMEGLLASAPTAELAQSVDVTRNNLGVYRVERERIREERKKVFGAERATQFAGLANDQFQRYRTHFANKSRVSRNGRLLGYIIDALQEILDGMEALRADGFNTDAHNKNIALVKQNLGIYREETKRIDETRKGTPLTQRIGELGGAANEVFKTYREHFAGKNRTTRDIGLLGEQIELLTQIAKQMDEIDRAEDDDVNAGNLALVMDMLYLYHREYNLVQQQKGES